MAPHPNIIKAVNVMSQANDISNYKYANESWAEAALRHELNATDGGHTSQAWGFHKAALCYEQDQNFKKAADCFLKEAKHRSIPKDKGFALGRAGNCYEKCGDWSNAAKCFVASAMWQKNNKKEFPLTRAGNAYEKAGDWSNAAKYFVESVIWQRPAQKKIALSRAGSCYEKLEDWANAADCFLKETEFQTEMPRKIVAFDRAGNCYLRLKAWEKAAHCFLSELEYQKDSNRRRNILMRIASCLAHAGRGKKAFEYAEQARKLIENNANKPMIARIANSRTYSQSTAISSQNPMASTVTNQVNSAKIMQEPA